jgi:hypothetical protein
VYDPAERPDIVVLIPVPFVVTPPGNLVTVQVPLDGNPFRTTLPVDNPHVGCTTVPIWGSEGFELTVSA